MGDAEQKVIVIGAGLAGCEAALQLAKRGISVDLYEMRPHKTTGAHSTQNLAEFVCSNSLGSFDVTNASGLLKKEMEMLGSFLIKVAHEVALPAGNALAIDRVLFSQKVEELINQTGKINLIREEIKTIPQNVPVILASGPLTSDDLAEDIKKFTGSEHLHFFDAILTAQRRQFWEEGAAVTLSGGQVRMESLAWSPGQTSGGARSLTGRQD